MGCFFCFLRPVYGHGAWTNPSPWSVFFYHLLSFYVYCFSLIFGRKKSLGEKSFWANKVFGRKKFWAEKSFGPNKVMAENFVTEKKFWLKKCWPKISLGFHSLLNGMMYRTHGLVGSQIFIPQLIIYNPGLMGSWDSLLSL